METYIGMSLRRVPSNQEQSSMGPRRGDSIDTITSSRKALLKGTKSKGIGQFW